MLTFLVTNIAASAFAERCRVPTYVFFSIIMSGKFRLLIKISLLFLSIGIVYPFLAHWMWGTNGWLGSVVGARVCSFALLFLLQYMMYRTMVVVQ
jgi:ammonia channel protein AmtB